MVHGTNDADILDEGTRWWQRGSGFTERLKAELIAAGINAELRHLHWSGANSDHDRLRGAADLARELRAIERQGRRYAVIGHSHGGNVTMEGVGEISRARGLAGLVTFGTPFFQRRLKLVPLIIALFQVLLGLTMTPLMIYYFVTYWSYLWSKGLNEKLIEPVVLFGGIGALTTWALWAGLRTLTRHWRVSRNLKRTVAPEDWLVIHSPRDEAMRLLETAAQLKPTYVTTSWGIRSLTGFGTIAGLISVAVTLWFIGDYLTQSLRDKAMAGEFNIGTAAELTFLLVLPVVFLIGWLAVWLFARLGGGFLYAFLINRFITGGLIGAAYGGDARDALIGVTRTPPPLPSVAETRIDATNLGGVDDQAIFSSAQDIYEKVLAEEATEGGFGDPDKMWKILSDALYHNAYMRDEGVTRAVAEFLAPRLRGP